MSISLANSVTRHLLLAAGLLFSGAIAVAAGRPDAPATPNTATAGPTRALGLYKPGAPVDLVDGFRDPPPISRAQCWWQCHGSAFTKREIARQLEEFKAKGMGGVTIKDTIEKPRDERTAPIEDIPFMSAEWLDMFEHIVAECGRLGLIVRSRLGSGWNCGGPWVTPEMASQAVRCAGPVAIEGPVRYSGPIPTEKGQPARAAIAAGEAFVVAVSASRKERIDLSGRVREDLTLIWDVPEGQWELFSCFSAPDPDGRAVMSSSGSGAGLHHDHLSEEGTDLQLAHVAEPMLARLGSFDDTAFDGFNVDSWELGNPTWTPGFRQTFIDRRGYDPVPFLPLFARIATRHIGRLVTIDNPAVEERRFLRDLRDTVSELVVETHYARISDWCREHGVALEGQAGGPFVVPRDMLSSQGAVDIPMGEFWMPEHMSYIKIASSAAHVYGKRLVGMESFTDTTKPREFARSPAAMKARLDEVLLLGGNYVNLAVTEYSPLEAGVPGWVHNAGPHINHNQTWWPLARPFFDYIGRSCFLLQSGEHVAHVAEYRPMRTADAQLWNETGDRLSSWPKTFTFDYVNEDVIERHMALRDGQLVLPSGATYQVLYIADSQPAIPVATLRKIRDLALAGATVVWAGERPSRAPGLADAAARDADVKALAEELWNGGRLITLETDDRFQLIPIVERSAVPPAWKMDDRQPLRLLHRRTATADIFFVVNRANNPVRESITFRIGDRLPEFWDATTGDILPDAHGKEKDGVEVFIEIQP